MGGVPLLLARNRNRKKSLSRGSLAMYVDKKKINSRSRLAPDRPPDRRTACHDAASKKTRAATSVVHCLLNKPPS